MSISNLNFFNYSQLCLQCQINGSFETAPVLFSGSLLFPTLSKPIPTVPGIVHCFQSHQTFWCFYKIPYFLLFQLSNVPWTLFLFPPHKYRFLFFTFLIKVQFNQSSLFWGILLPTCQINGTISSCLTMCFGVYYCYIVSCFE